MVEDVMTKEELARLDKDVAEAKSVVQSVQIDKVKEEAKKEAEKEFKLQQELESQRKAKEELEKQLGEQRKLVEEQAKKFQEQIDSLKTTKMPVNTENPFAKKAEGVTKSWTKEQLDAIEEASRREFFEQRGPGSR